MDKKSLKVKIFLNSFGTYKSVPLSRLLKGSFGDSFIQCRFICFVARSYSSVAYSSVATSSHWAIFFFQTVA